MNLESGVLQVHIEDIIPNRFQPRLNFDEQGLKELSDSIREHGIIQPLVLRKLGDKYEIIAGERRYKAAQIAGLSTVPAVVANIDDNKSAEVALVENVQRRDLTAIEEARSYKSLLDKGYLTQDQLAKRMGLSQPSIANKLRLLNLDEEVQQALLEEKISERHARTLLSLEDKAAQREWLHRIINERLTVRQLDLELKKTNNIPDSEEPEIPLVSSLPSIDDIRANAMDIKEAKNLELEPKEELETLETFDIPKENIESSSPFPTFDGSQNSTNESSFTTATTIPEFNITTPESVSSVYPETKMEPISEAKFFDTPSFSSVEPIDKSNNNGFVPVSDEQPLSKVLEVFDDEPNSNDSNLSRTNDDNETSSDSSSTNSLYPQPVEDKKESINTLDFNYNNRFFTPITNPDEITEIETKKDLEIDPMDAVSKLENPSKEPTSPGEKMDLKDAIAFIRQNIETLGEEGFYIDVEEIDFDSNYQITMRIHKDN